MKKLVALLLTFLLILTGCKTVEVTRVKDDIQTDGVRFSKEYKLDDDKNVFKYAIYDNVIETITSNTGIIFLGYSSNKESVSLIKILNEVSKEKELKEILYYDIKDIKDNNTLEYKKLKEILNIEEILVPSIIFVKEGNIISTFSNSDTELTEEEIKNNLYNLIDELKQEEKVEE